MTRAAAIRPDALCPLRPGFACNLCHPEAKQGPQDCPTVAIVMDDPDLREQLAQVRAAYRQRQFAAVADA